MSRPPQGLPLSWWAPTTLPILTTAASVALIGRECRVYGFSLIETTGAAPANVQIFDGAGPGGSDAIEIALTAGQSTRDWYGAPGLRFQTGAYLNVLAGSVRGALWVMGLSDDEIFRLNGYQIDE